jgi:hypothetical protein
MTLPDFETLVIERLVVCLGEISGINYVLENPPVGEVGLSSVPYAFPLVGAMVNTIPEQTRGAGRLVVTRNYPIIIEADKGERDQDGTRGEGSKGYRALRLLIAPIREYFLTHPLLQTDAGDNTDPLSYMHGDLAFQEQGIEDRFGRYALRINLIVTMSAVNTTTA